MTDRRYTLDEARKELARLACAEAGHRPDPASYDPADLWARCACAAVTWTGRNRDATGVITVDGPVG